MMSAAAQPAKRVRSKGDLRTVPVYVPSESFDHTILPGSGIVGDFEPSIGKVTLDFEGNKWGAENLTRYVERVMHAWDRHITRYPTISRMYVRSHEVLIVGDYDPLQKRVIVNPFDLPKLEKWLGMSPIPKSELVL